MSTAAKVRIRFFEGGNVVTVVAVPLVFLGALYFYPRLVAFFEPLKIDVTDVYTYVFNLYAIAIGGVLAMFVLFACRPTPFLERIKGTTTFGAIVANTNITLVLILITIVSTALLGIGKMSPTATLELKSVIFLAWCALAVATSAVCIRTVRLMFTALS